MRTTLTIDDDVAAKLARLAKGRRIKDVTNRALRLGLQDMESKSEDRPYRTKPVQGKPTIRNLDNIAEVIAETEGEDWR
jgi:hypothetical protein